MVAAMARGQQRLRWVSAAAAAACGLQVVGRQQLRCVSTAAGAEGIPCVLVAQRPRPCSPPTTHPHPQALDDPLEEMEKLAAASGVKGCAYCGGLGHRIGDCPKLKGEAKESSKQKKDYFGSGGFGGEM